MNAIMTALSPKVRKIVYATYAVVGLVLGAAQVGFSAVEVAYPDALLIAWQVYSYVGIAIGAVAAGNTIAPGATIKTQEPARHENVAG